MQDARDRFSVSSFKFPVFRFSVILSFVMALILGFAAHPSAMAEKKDQADSSSDLFLPVVYSPEAPGQTGTLVYTVGSGAEREIYTMKADHTDIVRLTENEAIDNMPSWSADGRLIAFTSDRRGPGSEHFDIYTMERNGSDVQRLTDSQWDVSSPSFSPEGDRIVFASNRNGFFQIFVMNSDGSGQQAITGDDYHSGDPEWSPDGTKIVFSSSRSGGLEIFTMNPDGSDKKNLTTGGGPDFRPSWSPDGKQIVFTTERAGEGIRRIYVMDADGSNLGPLTDSYSDWADWSPDGVRIVYTHQEENNVGQSTNLVEPLDPQQLFAARDGIEVADTNLYTMKPDGSDKQPLTQSPGASEDRANWGL
jgi:TolB protein